VFGPVAAAGIVVDMIIQNASADGTTDLTFTVPQADYAKAHPDQFPPEAAQKVAAITHVNDVMSFVRDVSSWFKHEDAPVPPAEVRSPFANADM